MKTPEEIKDDYLKEMMPSIIGVVSLSIARKIYMNELNPDEIKTREQFSKIVRNIGRVKNDGYEFNVETIPDQIKIIQYSISKNSYKSGIVLLFTLIESEINLSIRTLLRVRNFSHKNIKNALQGTDFRSKIDLLLPLLGLELPDRIKQLAFESHKLRNAIVHFKATPEIFSDEGNIDGDHTKTNRSTRNFFARNPIVRTEKDIESIIDLCLNSSPEICQAFDLFERFET